MEDEEEFRQQPDASEDGFNQPEEGDLSSLKEDDSYVLLPSSSDTASLVSS